MARGRRLGDLTPEYLNATDSFFRQLIGFTLPPRPGTIIADLGSDQYTVHTDDTTENAVTAYALNGFTYNVDDIVYILVAANAPDSGIILGGKGSSEGALAHDLLDGLGDDDHTIYLLLAGRSGGQTARGGADASDNLTLESTSHATKGNVVIQPSGGNVGIGQSSPDGTLHVQTGSAGTVTAAGGSDDLVVENNTNGGISILTPDADAGTLSFGSASDNTGAQVIWNHDNNLFRIATAKAGASIAIETANLAEAVRINSSGQVGIGVSSPDGALHVHTASAGSVTPSTGADDLTVENSAAGGISILVPDNQNSNLIFGSPSDAVGARLFWNHDSNLFTLGTENTGGLLVFATDTNTEAARIDASQNMIIGGAGSITPDDKLHVYSGSAGSVTAHANADELVIENSTTGGLNLLVPDASVANVFFGSPSDNVGARVNWGHDDDLMKVGTHKSGAEVAIESDNGTEAIRVDSSQNIGIGTTTPKGILHAFDGSVGFLVVAESGIDGTATTVIPGGTGDVTTRLRTHLIVEHSTAGGAISDQNITPGNSNGVSIGGNTMTTAVAAGGAVTFQRTAGSGTFTVVGLMWWL